jgi:hypothetical protein
MEKGDSVYALSVRQPFASLIAVGEKTIEWRSWLWTYRGPVVICASNSPKWRTQGKAPGSKAYLPTGAAVCIVDMVDCRPLMRGDLYAACVCDKKDGSDFDGDVDGYAFMLENPREVEPVEVKGQLRPWLWQGPELVFAPGWHDSKFEI